MQKLVKSMGILPYPNQWQVLAFRRQTMKTAATGDFPTPVPKFRVTKAFSNLEWSQLAEVTL